MFRSAFSIDIWSGSYKRDNRQLLNDPTASYSQIDITGADDDITAVSLKPAFLYYVDNFRLGGFVRLPMTFHIDEDNYNEYYSRTDGTYFQLNEIIDPTSQFTDDAYTPASELQNRCPDAVWGGSRSGKTG